MKREKRVISPKGVLMKVKIDYYDSQIRKLEKEIKDREKLIVQYLGGLKRIRKLRQTYNLMRP